MPSRHNVNKGKLNLEDKALKSLHIINKWNQISSWVLIRMLKFYEGLMSEAEKMSDKSYITELMMDFDLPSSSTSSKNNSRDDCQPICKNVYANGSSSGKINDLNCIISYRSNHKRCTVKKVFLKIS